MYNYLFINVPLQSKSFKKVPAAKIPPLLGFIMYNCTFCTPTKSGVLVIKDSAGRTSEKHLQFKKTDFLVTYKTKNIFIRLFDICKGPLLHNHQIFTKYFKMLLTSRQLLSNTPTNQFAPSLNLKNSKVVIFSNSIILTQHDDPKL